MRPTLFLLTLLLSFSTNVQSKVTLVNKNSKARGITKMKLYTNNQGRTYIKMYASCQPKNFYWGKFSTIKDGAYHEKLRRGINPAQFYRTITIKKSFVTRKVIIFKYQGQIAIRQRLTQIIKTLKEKTEPKLK